MQDKIKLAAEFIKAKIEFKPRIALILGTGLNPFAEIVTKSTSIPYHEIPGFVSSTAPSHQGNLICGQIEGYPLLIMQGRYHYYEGYDLQTVTFPVRVLSELGIEILIVTNASGSLNKDLKPGDLVLIKDHINFMGNNPLIGTIDQTPGDRFPSLNDAYNEALRNLIHRIAADSNLPLPEGIYAVVSGPSLETRAECLMLQKMGADLVGMSTVPEVIVGVQCGLKIIGLSVVTNYSNIFHTQAHNQIEIRKNAAKAIDNIKKLIINLIRKLSEV